MKQTITDENSKNSQTSNIVVSDKEIVEFKSEHYIFKKEKSDLKSNTVRKMDINDYRQEFLNKWDKSKAYGKIRIVSKSTGERFERQITDITQFEGLFIISWLPISSKKDAEIKCEKHSLNKILCQECVNEGSLVFIGKDDKIKELKDVIEIRGDIIEGMNNTIRDTIREFKSQLEEKEKLLIKNHDENIKELKELDKQLQNSISKAEIREIIDKRIISFEITFKSLKNKLINLTKNQRRALQNLRVKIKEYTILKQRLKL